ncbi:MAG: hypothetical protein VR69_08445 [Peptococcaceae bacterium BRH_c4b]|nr:MAG: hypothetical protein VR69_08445 [Peptococcaceae bacterium BRH_c4b]
MKKNILLIFSVAMIMLLLVMPGCTSKTEQTSTDKQGQTSSTQSGTTEEQGQETTGEKITKALAGVTAYPAGQGKSQEEGKMPRSETKLSPVPEVTADETLTIKGKTKGVNKIFVNGEETQVDPQGSFKHDVRLETGANTIEVVTLNPKGIPDKQSITVTYQPLAPKLLALAPDSSDTETVTISGQTGPDCFVYVNSNRTKPDKKGNFSLPVQLRPGANTIKVVSTNPQGGQASVTNNVTFSPPEPRLVFILPDKTASKELAIGGITDAGAVLIVYVNDVKTNINNSNGTFTGTVQLQEGLNTITAQVANKWGQTRTVQKRINYEPVYEDEYY